MSTPEIKQNSEIIPEPINEVAEQYKESPVEVSEGIQATQVHPTQLPQVQTQSGSQVSSVPAPQSGVVTIPAEKTTLMKQSGGGVSDTKTWNAWFWLRVIKKAIKNQLQLLVKN